MNNVAFFLFLVILPWVKIPIVFIVFLCFSVFFSSPVHECFDQKTSHTSYYNQGKCYYDNDINNSSIILFICSFIIFFPLYD